MATDPSHRFPLSGSVGVGGLNHPADVLAVQRRLLGLGHTWLKPDGVVGRSTVQSIRLLQSIVNGYQTVGAHPENDGLVEPGKGTHLWLQAANAPRWQLMPQGTPEAGFMNVERIDQADHHDWGTSWLADTCLAIAAAYREQYLAHHPEAALMMLNDASLPRGGDTADHERHETGLCCDLRLPRRPASLEGRITLQDPAYDLEATRALLTVIRQQPLFSLVYLNDPVLRDEGLCEFYHGHEDHIHFEIHPPAREE